MVVLSGGITAVALLADCIAAGVAGDDGAVGMGFSIVIVCLSEQWHCIRYTEKNRDSKTVTQVLIFQARDWPQGQRLVVVARL